MGKGKPKTKGKKIQLGDFIGDTGNKIAVNGEMMELPSAPRATTLEIDVSLLPARPPFTASVANLVYEIQEEDLQKFFDDIPNITRIDIPREEDDIDGGQKGRFKGVAYVTVDGNRDSCISSMAKIMAKNDTMLAGRRAKIEIYDEFSSRGGGRGGDRYGRDDRDGRDDRRGGRERDPGFGRSDDADDWRRPAAPSRDDRGGFGGDRYGSRGGYDDRRGGDRYGGDRYGGDRYGGDRYGGDRDRDRGYGDRDRYGGDRYGDRGGYGDRDRGYGRDDRDRGYGRDDRDRGFGGSRYSSAADEDNQWRRAEPEIPRRDPRDEVRRDAPRERPKLQLSKRTVNTEESAPKAAGSSASIFGSAKPIDTAKKEREIEQKLSKLSVDDKRPPRSSDRKPSLTAEERAKKAEEDLKRRVESGELAAGPESNQREELGAQSRFAALEDE
ncbi:Oidioi.mRNA.OKI2018_I69.chr2.g7629.t1.cds [Oikopleura dioica]|uniref:Oidioi.mRNA.OKI2018_I69.chr2.g7629.t1.cds n=1 Tax=Oikopleura dioica TaxID=34765 RepID=A0ABN7TBI9_OIKDI|nr:Oidioi.mRNA.OKI2018_I69.chr2.g7629.t1.cds [Oikopleura dioica]